MARGPDGVAFEKLTWDTRPYQAPLWAAARPGSGRVALLPQEDLSLARLLDPHQCLLWVMKSPPRARKGQGWEPGCGGEGE